MGLEPVPEKESSRTTVLLADAGPPFLKALNRTFLEESSQILTPEKNHQGLPLLEQEPVSLIIFDPHRPVSRGIDPLREDRNRWPDICFETLGDGPNCLLCGSETSLSNADNCKRI